MDKIYSENDLILPALKIIYEKSKDAGDGITSSDLVEKLREILKPTGEDLLPLQGRKDDKFSQKVRNLISHKTISKYINKEDENKNAKITITKDGFDYLNELNEIDDDDDDSDNFLDQNEDYKNFKDASVENIYFSIADLKRKYDRYKNKYENNVLYLDADFQRGDNIWNNKRKSWLIESVLLDIPIPSIYLSEDKNGNLIVVDGRQRLSAFFDFMDDGFKLKGLKILKTLNDKKFSQLKDSDEKYRVKIEDKSLHIAKIRYSSGEIFTIETFSRVNTTGVRLNAQEIRNALHKGQSTKLLNEISKTFDENEKIVSKKRMKDKYLILRFFAMDMFYKEIIAKKEIKFDSITDYLGYVMEKINKYNGEKINELKEEFIKIFNRAIVVFGEQSAFRLSIGAPLNMVLFEISLLLTKYQYEKKDEEIKQSLDIFMDKGINKKEEAETPFLKNIRFHRDSKNNINERLNWVKNIIETRKK